MTTTPHPPRTVYGAPPPTAPDGEAHARGRAAGGSRLARMGRGRPEDPRWGRPALLALLLVTGLFQLWNLSASGWANSFYSAAVQAGGSSWKAFLFGSLDGANSITVDKPPASLWPMDLSVRLFGVNPWSILVPEVLMGVATVAVLYAAVRRHFGPAAGLLAGGTLAVTPVATLMFRYDNPDALLALLLTLSVYLVVRALEDGRTKWLVGAGVAVGFAFLAKQLQAFLVLPPLAVLYAVCGPRTLRGRLGQLLAAGLAMVVAGGWWVALVELWPASSRPYIGGSTDNSFLNLTFGYNGLSRVSGGGSGPGGRGAGGGGIGGTGSPSALRLFNDSLGGQVSWLLPAALILLVAGLVLTRGAGRTDIARSAFLAWGGALLATAAVFSSMSGIFHAYYTVAIAPYIAALVGMGTVALWRARAGRWALVVLGAAVAATAVWGYVLLGRTGHYGPLKWFVLCGGLAAALSLRFAARWGRRAVLGIAGLGLAASLAGPFAYSVTTLTTVHKGGMPTAGPASTARSGGPGGGLPPGMGRGGPGRSQGKGQGLGPGGLGQGRGSGMPGGGMPPGGPGGGQVPGGGRGGQAPPGVGRGEGMPGGGPGGGENADSKVTALLEQDAGRYTWVAAGVSTHSTAAYQLATGKPVMAIGGFNGTDPSPTPAAFKKLVAQGRIHYFISGGTGSSTTITSWVASNFKKVTVGGATLYDLTRKNTS
ncbi:glycosyltransferase family 39 protein [Streptomyces sp. NPDC048664]|uniref:glycosyltransferase family 39 protein n=1 Tax=Streptomyces sp. NPDC048664 TaxID=3154505 RepID=UPI0034127A53